MARKSRKVDYVNVGNKENLVTEAENQCEKVSHAALYAMAESEGITEQLKATDQVAWVGEMNNIWSRAREVVNAELIYN